MVVAASQEVIAPLLTQGQLGRPLLGHPLLMEGRAVAIRHTEVLNRPPAVPPLLAVRPPLAVLLPLAVQLPLVVQPLLVVQPPLAARLPLVIRLPLVARLPLATRPPLAIPPPLVTRLPLAVLLLLVARPPLAIPPPLVTRPRRLLATPAVVVVMPPAAGAKDGKQSVYRVARIHGSWFIAWSRATPSTPK